MDSQAIQIEENRHFTPMATIVQPVPDQALPYQSSQFSAPIHALPPEILGEIFLMANLYCVHGSRSDHDAALLRVCRSWRELALGTPLLWSHIDLTCDGVHDDAYYNRARVWIERSAGVALDIDIRLLGELGWEGDSAISKMTRFLAPLSGRVQYYAAGWDMSLDFFSLEDILYAISKTNAFQTTDILHLWSTRYLSSPLRRWSPPSVQLVLPPPSQATEPSPPARILRLENIVFMGGSGLYSGLTELYLEFLPTYVCLVTQLDIIWVLKFSPALCLFSLINVDVSRNSREFEPVLLEHSNLQHMTLISSSVETFEILELFAPMEQSLSMSASTIPDPSYINAMRSFFSRSNVTSLHYTPSGRVEQFVSISKVLPQLEDITFEHFSTDDPLWPTLPADYGGHLTPGRSDSSLYKITTSTHTYLFC